MADMSQYQSPPANSSVAPARFPQPKNEVERLAALQEYQILDSLPEQSFDDLTKIAAHICRTPIALVSLLDQDRQWFKSHQGLDVTETPREQAFCSHAILHPQALMVVADAAADERFKNNPLVQGDPHIRFYAGAPLVTPEGMPLGTLCVIDRVPRQLTAPQQAAIQALSRQVVAQLELRRQAYQLRQEKQELQRTLQKLQTTQATLVESEKMSAIGQIVVDIAQKMSNPLTFIHCNLGYCKEYSRKLFELIEIYQADPPDAQKASDFLTEIDFPYLKDDLPKLFASMQKGMQRIQSIVQSLRTFSHHNEVGIKHVDLHENLDAVCELLGNHFEATTAKIAVQLEKQYGTLPEVPCIPSQLNQAFMHLIYNGIDAVRQGVGSHHPIDTLPCITIATEHLRQQNTVQITISDNSSGILEECRAHIFEPSYLTQKVGVGLAISHQLIVQEHRGTLQCRSKMGLGTTMVVTLPLWTKPEVAESLSNRAARGRCLAQ